MLLEEYAEPRALLDVPAAVDPVGAGDAHQQGSGLGQRRANGVDDLEQQAGAVLEGAAVARRRDGSTAARGTGGAGSRGPRGPRRCRTRPRRLAGSRRRTRAPRRRSARPTGAPGRRTPRRGRPTARPSPSRRRRAGPCRTARPTDGRSRPCVRRGRAGCRSGAPWLCTKSTMRRQASACSSFQMPASCGEMRPSGTTAEASVMTSPKPPVARAPRCTRCQSSGTPSIEEYWHIGASQTRLRTVSDRSVIGSNSFDTGFSSHDGRFSATTVRTGICSRTRPPPRRVRGMSRTDRLIG